MSPIPQTIDFDWHGRNVELLKLGDAGDLVLCLHCTGSQASQWNGLSKSLLNETASLQIVSPNLGGVGGTSDVPAGTGRLAYELQLLDAVIRQFGDSVHLVGHSYGGIVAAKLTLGNPDLIRTLTLIEPAITGRRELLEEHNSDDPRVKLINFFEFAGPPGGWESFSDGYQQYLLGNAELILDQIEAIHGDDTTLQSYAQIMVPTLVIKGAKSPASLIENTTSIAKVIPAARMETIPGAGHMLPVTHPLELSPLVSRHVQAYRDSS